MPPYQAKVWAAPRATESVVLLQFSAWQQASLGFMAQPPQAYESNYRGYPGKVGRASAACTADLIVEDMVTEAASEQATPQEAVARAEQRARRY
jgi:multiple sugar transport system substrate-binding protein